MPRRAALPCERDETERTKDADEIFLFTPNPFAMAERLGVETQGESSRKSGENDETDVDQV
jgi:hypothetical protein